MPPLLTANHTKRVIIQHSIQFTSTWAMTWVDVFLGEYNNPIFVKTME